MHRALVQSAALWGAPAWPVNQSLLQAANSVQLQQVRMPGHARRPGQSFPEWQARTLRDARVTLHRQGYERWSTVALASIWGAMGPRCARTTQPSKPTAPMEGHGVVGAAQNYRRHPGQYNPFRDPETPRDTSRGLQAPTGGHKHSTDPGGNSCSNTSSKDTTLSGPRGNSHNS